MKILAQIRRMQNNSSAPAYKGAAPNLASLEKALEDAQSTSEPSGGVLSWIKNPSIALSTFKSYMTKRATVEIDETFKSSMEGVIKLQNKSLDELIAQYSQKNPTFASLLIDRKKIGLKVRVQLLNLIASVIDYLGEYKKSASKAATSGAKLISVTENVLDDILLYLVYIYERDDLSIRIKESLRARGNRTALPNTMEQVSESSLVPWFAKQYELPYEFNVILNTILHLNSERAKIWGILPGYGIRETSHFPYLEGTDNEELSLDELKSVYTEYIQIARVIESKKVKILGEEPMSKNISSKNRGNLLKTLERLADEMPSDTETLNNYRKQRNVVISESAPTSVARANTSNNSYMNLFHNTNAVTNTEGVAINRPVNPQSQMEENIDEDSNLPTFNRPANAPANNKANVPVNRANVPVNRANASVNRANAPANRANVPANNKANVPMNKANVPANNKANVPVNKSNSSANSNSNSNTQPPQKRTKLNRKSRKSSRKSSNKTRRQRKNSTVKH
jgi:hypothetical protein